MAKTRRTYPPEFKNAPKESFFPWLKKELVHDAKARKEQEKSAMLELDDPEFTDGERHCRKRLH